MKTKILAAAMDDLYDGFRFYERQTPGLGTYFFRSLFADIDSLEIHAGIHAVHFGYYRLLSRRFPYAVFYRMEQEMAVVYRVLDTRRDPASIEDGLK